jgi:hypothetical protein
LTVETALKLDEHGDRGEGYPAESVRSSYEIMPFLLAELNVTLNCPVPTGAGFVVSCLLFAIKFDLEPDGREGASG